VPPKKSPGPHPEPPPDLAARLLPLLSLDAPWYRIYDIHFDPLFFGRTGDHRFDCPYPRAFGVLYLAATVDGAFIETLGHETGITVVAEAELRGWCRRVSGPFPPSQHRGMRAGERLQPQPKGCSQCASEGTSEIKATEGVTE
jgi:hypothetical protein